jgi:hypothetical protein
MLQLAPIRFCSALSAKDLQGLTMVYSDMARYQP